MLTITHNTSIYTINFLILYLLINIKELLHIYKYKNCYIHYIYINSIIDNRKENKLYN